VEDGAGLREVRRLERRMFDGGGGDEEGGMGVRSTMGSMSTSILSGVGWTDVGTVPFVLVRVMAATGGGGC